MDAKNRIRILATVTITFTLTMGMTMPMVPLYASSLGANEITIGFIVAAARL